MLIRLQVGELKSAVGELEKLQGFPADTVRDWLADAKSRLLADEVTGALYRKRMIESVAARAHLKTKSTSCAHFPTTRNLVRFFLRGWMLLSSLFVSIFFFFVSFVSCFCFQGH